MARRWLSCAHSRRSSADRTRSHVRPHPASAMSHSTDFSPIARVMRRVDEATDGSPSRDTIATGFPSVDKLLGGGVRRGDLVVVGGDVASGKSALALAFALRAASEEREVAFLSGEMGVSRIMERALAIEGR